MNESGRRTLTPRTAGLARPRRRWPQVILVNGPSSAGKSTLSRALQAAVTHPYLVVGFDDFVFMSAPRYYGGTDTGRPSSGDEFTALGVEMVPTSAPGEPPSVVARFGPVFRRLLDAMAPAVRTLVDHGNDVVFDHVLHDREAHDGMVAAFAGLAVFAVGVTCATEILEERERARGDRVLGRARGLASVVHDFCKYDVVVDSGVDGPAACVAQVLAALDGWRPRDGSAGSTGGV